ncbi:4570_t:CDS:2 [Cetraspora pellucida]|uniref:4570_t:CDS:1 n=1 Tax=Cetraspora pellucida TaxID=1433469 RepID=A0A9N9GBV2_9GLOM|nr:4570_t:CDS:2 [Cetraspora pellucida]
MISQIETFFSEVETLIEFQLSNGIQIQEQEIKQKFTEGKALIDKLEEEDEEQHGFYKLRYHSTYASYLKTINKRVDIDENESIMFIDDKSDSQSSDSGKKDLEEAIRKILRVDILGEMAIESIRKHFENLNEIPKTFEDYYKLVSCENSLFNSLNVLINEELIILDQLNEGDGKSNQSEIEQKMMKVRDRLVVLKDLKEFASQFISQTVYQRKLDFIHNTLNSPNKKAILFSNILFTKDGINKRFRELASCFHPDKIKESLLDNLENTSRDKGVIYFHEKKANTNCNIANDYRSAYNNNWNKLKILNKEDTKEIPHNELKRLSVYYGTLAHGEYRAACKVADTTGELKKQIKLRGSMAICLYICDHFLEAQQYALSAIRLIYQHSKDVSKEELIEAKKIFDKVKGVKSQLNTDIKLKNELGNSQALVKVVKDGMSFLEMNAIQSSINDDLRKISAELMFKPNRQIVNYQASERNILHTKEFTIRHRIAGAVTLASAALGTTLTVVGGVALFPATLAVVGVAALFHVTIIPGLSLLALVYSVNTWRQDALAAYDEGDYQKVFNLLSEEYKKDTSIINLKGRYDNINPESIIDSLLSHGFRSDGIAYLLNLIGEVLSSGKIKIPGIDRTRDDLNAIGKRVFEGALNEKLVKEAKALDNRVHTLRKDDLKGKAESIFHNYIDILFLKSYSELAKEYIDKEDKHDAKKMPFQSRLEEMRNISKLNLAIFDILNTDKAAITRVSNTVKEIRESISGNYQFSGSTESRLEVLEDFLWIMSGEVPRTPSVYSIKPAEERSTEKRDNKYNEYLKEKLEMVFENNERIGLHTKLADCHVKLAEEYKVNLLSSLRHWQDAQEHYEKAREIDPKNQYATLGFAKCLLNLSQYNRLVKLFDTNPDLTSSAEYWRFCSIASCKQIKYDKSSEWILEALRLDPQNILAMKQKEHLDRLKEYNVEDRINHYNKKIFDVDNLISNSHRSNENSVYRILSIDGGGVRGILPALWLSELEYRARKPIYQLFNMIAGTSTGGIIGAGLSMPRQNSSLNSPLLATDLLELYQNQAKSMFTGTTWNIFATTKYTDEGRSLIFNKYFGKIRLNESLTELVIPAVNKDNMQSYSFTRRDSINNNSNDTLFDILMATTAAPTFFPPYKMRNKGIFVDGGVQLNNPALTAYNEAIKYNKNITVLSLGTGSYIPNPLRPDLYYGQLFWAKKSRNDTQGYNDDSLMYDMLGDCYQRWQILLDKPVAFDDYNSISSLLELGHQYIEELDASDENPINVLVESFS